MFIASLLAVSTIIAAPMPAISAADDSPAQYQSLVEKRAAAVVTVKFVLKAETGGDTPEQEGEAYGVMIDPTGLVMMSNSDLDGFASLMRRMRGGAGLTTATRDIKVLVGDDTDGVPAKFVARDSELDLAWVQIEKAPDKPYVHIDLTKSVPVKLGDRVLGLERMGKYFDRTPVVAEVRVGAVTSKPRLTYVFTAGTIAGRGVPVFTAGGDLVGITTLLVPSADELPAADMRTTLGGYYGPLPKILPAAELVTATKRAREAGAEGEKKPAAEGGAGEKKPE